MKYDEWETKLIEALAVNFGMSQAESASYVADCGAEWWGESFADGQSPENAALEELNAAAEHL